MSSIQLTKDTEERLREKVDSGAFRSEEDVVQAGLDLLDESEEINAAIAEAEKQFERGEIVTASESRARIAKLAERFRKE